MEKHILYVCVIMLARVNQGLFYCEITSECAQHWRNFHKVRARSSYVKDMHSIISQKKLLC